MQVKIDFVRPEHSEGFDAIKPFAMLRANGPASEE